ncbi:MAG TPA: MiaB/RimO family radical SAM methylthiotransferase [Desulfosarcina sp.]|nr:MiaB/RimO family radical SAM methylthiotransferase [Desulfosarcina sp.]
MNTFTIKTLGCKVNQCESEAIRSALQEAGRKWVDGADGPADVVVVNTCTVTGKAAMQSRQAVRQAIRANPGARIVVTGCHAQTAADELAAIEGVDLVVGNRDKHLIHRQILAAMPSKEIGRSASDRAGIDAVDRFDALPGIAHGGRTRPFLKVQDGCNAFCTYCIVPHARGRSRSLPVDQVLHQIEALGRLGYREVVLTGIHIGCYGADLTPATGLYDLLCRIRDLGAVDRIRLSSIEPNELGDDIIGLAAADDAASGRLCPHFHIPLQSGDNGILRRMHRPYASDDFGGLVRRIVAQLPDAAVGVDTLIGFPGETDHAFENTLSLIQAMRRATFRHRLPSSRSRLRSPASDVYSLITCTMAWSLKRI